GPRPHRAPPGPAAPPHAPDRRPGRPPPRHSSAEALPNAPAGEMTRRREPGQMRIATRSDWKTQPMPAENERIALERDYSIEEFDRLRAGLVPQEMEDRWFIYFEDPWLFLHRSWTGFCI